MRGTSALSEALQRLPLFAGLPEEQLARIAEHALHQRYGRGHTIFTRGDPGDRAYIILDGTIDLVIDSPDGRELILSRLGPGEHFGEMALVDDHRRSASARAASATELVVVLRQTFLEALDEQPEIARHIIRSLVQRLRAADEKIEAFAYLDAAGRIARVVMELDRGRQEPLRVSHEELSHMSGTSRQTTTRVLGEWEESGYVQLARRGIQVQDPVALSALAQL